MDVFVKSETACSMLSFSKCYKCLQSKSTEAQSILKLNQSLPEKIDFRCIVFNNEDHLISKYRIYGEYKLNFTAMHLLNSIRITNNIVFTIFINNNSMLCAEIE